MKISVTELAAKLMRQPTAPYHEHAVRDEVERICREHRLRYRIDPFGNAHVELKTASRQRPLVLAAHLDHPGFEIIRPLRKNAWLARFCGGVPDSYFKPGAALSLFPGAVPAKLGARRGKQKVFTVSTNSPPAQQPAFAMWGFAAFALRNGRIISRACDDLAGAAVALATLLRLKEQRVKTNVLALLSRAEEVGFHGAMAAAKARLLPATALVVSLETSRELPGARMREGVILRTGDRTSVFDSAAMRFLGEVAAELKKARNRFKFQRALMSGGTCEATAFREFGFQTGAVCVALRNYHNCAPKNRLAPEYVSLKDAESMAELLVAAARAMPRFDKLANRLPARLKQMARQSRKRLLATAWPGRNA